MPTIASNIYENNIFTFKSMACECAVDKIHISPNIPATSQFKIIGKPEHTINFAYAAQKGLVTIRDNGTIDSQNILGEFIALANKTEKQFIDFFEKYGFLFPVEMTEYDNIAPSQIYAVAEQLRNTVELMTEINNIQKDYTRIMTLILLLITSPTASIKTSLMEKEYTTCIHKLSQMIQNPDQFASENPSHQIVRFNKNSYTIYDSVYNEERELDIQKYNEVLGGYASGTLFSSIIYLYANFSGFPVYKKEIDVIFHLLNDYGDLQNVSYEEGIFINDKIATLSFDENMKEAIIETAQQLVAEEINSNLIGIYPHYDAITMTPSWRVDSLLSALYFSIFYIKPGLELYRPCANPRCGRYFLVKTTSTKTKYCSSECCNRMTQDKYRKKIREKSFK